MTLEERAEEVARSLRRHKPENYAAVLSVALSSVWAECRQNAVEIVMEHYQGGRQHVSGRLRGMDYSEMFDRKDKAAEHVCGASGFSPEKGDVCAACKVEHEIGRTNR